jgi:hypothetical protein
MIDRRRPQDEAEDWRELDGDELERALVEEFPLGDGIADTDALVACPWCGEANQIGLDPGSGADQEYVEDCEVCCRPWRVRVRYHGDGSAETIVEPLS